MAVGLVEGVPAYLWGSPDHFLSIIALGMTAVGLLVAATLWLWPGLLAWWAVRRQSGEVFESRIDADQIQYIAFSVLGCWLLIFGLATVLQQGIYLWLLRSSAEADARALPATYWVGLIKSLATMVAGAALMLGSHGLVGLLHRLRGYPPYRASVEVDPDASATQDG